MNLKLSKHLMKLHLTHGYRADEYFQWMVDDCLAGFGRRLSEEEIPPEEVRPILYELGQLYAREIIDNKPFADILGDTYQELASEYGKKSLGQYFTPRSVARLMAQLQGPYDFRDRELVRFADLGGCGSGALLLGAAAEVFSTNPDDLERMSVTGVDLDRLCAKMYPTQFLGNCLIHQVVIGELVAYQGNGLGRFEDWSVIIHTSSKKLPSHETPPAKSTQRKAMVEDIQKTLTKEDQIALPL